MKWIILGLVFVLVVVGVVGGLLAATGQLNKESLRRILRVEKPQPPPEPADDLDTLSKAIRAREAELEARERALEDKLKRLEIEEQGMAELQTQMDQILADVAQTTEELDADREAYLDAAASTLADLDEQKAVAILDDMPADEAAEVLGRVGEKDRNKIFDAMEPARVAEILPYLRPARKTPTPSR